MNFAEELKRRKALIKAEREGTKVEPTPEESVEVIKQSKPRFNTNQLVWKLFFMSMILNVFSGTIVVDWFNFMGSPEYAVWKVTNVKGSSSPRLEEKKCLYKAHVKGLVKK